MLILLSRDPVNEDWKHSHMLITGNSDEIMLATQDHRCGGPPSLSPKGYSNVLKAIPNITKLHIIPLTYDLSRL